MHTGRKQNVPHKIEKARYKDMGNAVIGGFLHGPNQNGNRIDKSKKHSIRMNTLSSNMIKNQTLVFSRSEHLQLRKTEV